MIAIMSVYSTPTKTCFDEGSSPCSQRSVYFTPRETFSYLTPQTRSRKRATPYKGRIPKFNVYNEELSQSEENSPKDNHFSHVSSPIPIAPRHDRWGFQTAYSAKETVISINKENIGVRFCSTPTLPSKITPEGCTPLRDVSNQLSEKNETIFEARISSIGKNFDLRIRSSADSDQLKKCNVESNPPFTPRNTAEERLKNCAEKDTSRANEGKGNLLRGFNIGRKLQRKSNIRNSRGVQESGSMNDTLTQTGNELNLDLRTKDDEKVGVPRIQSVPLQIKKEILNVVKNSPNDSRTPLSIEKKTPSRRMKFWQFTKIKKFRISPVKRLFTKPSKCLLSFKEKIAKRFFLHPIKTLFTLKPHDVSCISSESTRISSQTQQICLVCLENQNNKEETMSKTLSALMTKLTSMEEELKEIKSLVKNNSNSISSHAKNASLQALPPLPPPPPPPPPPPNFLNMSQPSGTLKRKADLTTPENVNHVVKRPAIKNEKTQFSITVEDIRSVKLRKTPAHVFKPREMKESNTTNGDEALRLMRTKKTRKSVVNGGKRTQSLAELSSRENVTINRESLMDSNIDTPLKKDLSTICLHEETPISSKNTLISSRSQKRKEWLIESPMRKRVNTGNNSAIYCNTELEY